MRHDSSSDEKRSRDTTAISQQCSTFQPANYLEKEAAAVKISVHSEKEHVLHGGVNLALYRTNIRYSHKEASRKKYRGGGLIPGCTV